MTSLPNPFESVGGLEPATERTAVTSKTPGVTAGQFPFDPERFLDDIMDDALPSFLVSPSAEYLKAVGRVK